MSGSEINSGISGQSLTLSKNNYIPLKMIATYVVIFEFIFLPNTEAMKTKEGESLGIFYPIYHSQMC